MIVSYNDVKLIKYSLSLEKRRDISPFIFYVKINEADNVIFPEKFSVCVTRLLYRYVSRESAP